MTFSIEMLIGLIIPIFVFFLLIWVIGYFIKNKFPDYLDKFKEIRDWVIFIVFVLIICGFVLTGVRVKKNQPPNPKLELKSIEFVEVNNISEQLLKSGELLQKEGSKSLDQFRKDHLND